MLLNLWEKKTEIDRLLKWLKWKFGLSIFKKLLSENPDKFMRRQDAEIMTEMEMNVPKIMIEEI